MTLKASVSMTCLAVALGLGLTSAALAQAQPAPSTDYKPSVGQQGKDVVWVPSPQALVDRMLDMAKATTSDFVIDLGSGDGRTVITAAKRGINALGIEYNPDMVALAQRNAAEAGVTDKAKFEKADLFESDFSKATVITMFLLPNINLRLRPKILDMKPGTRIVSNTFDMGEWQADDQVQATTDCTSYCRAYFWIVPAKVDGGWRSGNTEIKLEQKFQQFTGTVTTGNVVAPISNGRLVGDTITFTAGSTEYTGKVNGDAIEGTARTNGTDAKWQASRVAKS
ncbi:MAG: RNA methyltransferase [Rhizobiales bacterium 62-17]|nr:class I SAM-dependent methyltransferase [Hyphomicrobiales bacterium]OJY04584.1 MAG: RNA methyltransferase [Rhizobiales bacterium 62-17]